MADQGATFLTLGGATVTYNGSSREMKCGGCGHSSWLASAAEANAHAARCRAMPPASKK